MLWTKPKKEMSNVAIVLRKEEPLDIKGTRFIHLSGKNLPSGILLAIHLSGLPKADNQEVLKWTALVPIVLVSGFGFSYLLGRKRFQPVGPEDSLDQRRQRLLVEIAQLDDDFEDGKISEEVHRRMRSERKAQLVELIQRSEEESVIDNGGKVIFLDVLSFQLAAITASATVGFVTVGTLFLALAVSTKAREIVLPIFFSLSWLL